MIDVKELRMGNFVYLPLLSESAYGHENVPFCVEGIFTENGEYKVLCHCETKELYNCTEDAIFYEIEPVPITEELLLKCGFERCCGEYHNRVCVHNGIDMSKNDYPNDNGSFVSVNIGSLFSKEVKYLHQLQNIYYALTGKELEVEL